MLSVGDVAPKFTVPMAPPENAGDVGAYTSDHVQRFDLGEALDGGPVVLAFFPGVFSRTCTQELCEVRDRRADLADLAAGAGDREEGTTAPQVYGVSVDTPWSQLAFAHEYDLSYPLLSGFTSDVIADYDVRREEGLLHGLATRAVYVVVPDRTVAYAWGTDEPLTFPDLDAVREAIEVVGGDTGDDRRP